MARIRSIRPEPGSHVLSAPLEPLGVDVWVNTNGRSIDSFAVEIWTNLTAMSYTSDENAWFQSNLEDIGEEGRWSSIPCAHVSGDLFRTMLLPRRIGRYELTARIIDLDTGAIHWGGAFGSNAIITVENGGIATASAVTLTSTFTKRFLQLFGVVMELFREKYRREDFLADVASRVEEESARSLVGGSSLGSERSLAGIDTSHLRETARGVRFSKPCLSRRVVFGILDGKRQSRSDSGGGEEDMSDEEQLTPGCSTSRRSSLASVSGRYGSGVIGRRLIRPGQSSDMFVAYTLASVGAALHANLTPRAVIIALFRASLGLPSVRDRNRMPERVPQTTTLLTSRTDCVRLIRVCLGRSLSRAAQDVLASIPLPTPTMEKRQLLAMRESLRRKAGDEVAQQAFRSFKSTVTDQGEDVRSSDGIDGGSGGGVGVGRVSGASPMSFRSATNPSRSFQRMSQFGSGDLSALAGLGSPDPHDDVDYTAGTSDQFHSSPFPPRATPVLTHLHHHREEEDEDMEGKGILVEGEKVLFSPSRVSEERSSESVGRSSSGRRSSFRETGEEVYEEDEWDDAGTVTTLPGVAPHLRPPAEAYGSGRRALDLDEAEEYVLSSLLAIGSGCPYGPVAGDDEAGMNDAGGGGGSRKRRRWRQRRRKTISTSSSSTSAASTHQLTDDAMANQRADAVFIELLLSLVRTGGPWILSSAMVTGVTTLMQTAVDPVVRLHLLHILQTLYNLNPHAMRGITTWMKRAERRGVKIFLQLRKRTEEAKEALKREWKLYHTAHPPHSPPPPPPHSPTAPSSSALVPGPISLPPPSARSRSLSLDSGAPSPKVQPLSSAQLPSPSRSPSLLPLSITPIEPSARARMKGDKGDTGGDVAPSTVVAEGEEVELDEEELDQLVKEEEDEIAMGARFARLWQWQVVTAVAHALTKRVRVTGLSMEYAVTHESQIPQQLLANGPDLGNDDEDDDEDDEFREESPAAVPRFHSHITPPLHSTSSTSPSPSPSPPPPPSSSSSSHIVGTTTTGGSGVGARSTTPIDRALGSPRGSPRSPRRRRGSMSLAGGFGRIDTDTGVLVRPHASVPVGSLEDLLAFCVFAVQVDRAARQRADALASIRAQRGRSWLKTRVTTPSTPFSPSSFALTRDVRCSFDKDDVGPFRLVYALAHCLVRLSSGTCGQYERILRAVRVVAHADSGVAAFLTNQILRRWPKYDSAQQVTLLKLVVSILPAWGLSGLGHTATGEPPVSLPPSTPPRRPLSSSSSSSSSSPQSAPLPSTPKSLMSHQSTSCLSEDQLSKVPPLESLRSALITRLCHCITSDNVALSTAAMQLAQPTPVSTSPSPVISLLLADQDLFARVLSSLEHPNIHTHWCPAVRDNGHLIREQLYAMERARIVREAEAKKRETSTDSHHRHPRPPPPVPTTESGAEDGRGSGGGVGGGRGGVSSSTSTSSSSSSTSSSSFTPSTSASTSSLSAPLSPSSIPPVGGQEGDDFVQEELCIVVTTRVQA